MKAFLSIAILLISLTNCSVDNNANDKKAEQTITNQPITTAEVKTAIDQWVQLWATYDLNMLPEIFWQSDDLTYFSSEKEGVIKGYSQLPSHHAGFGFVEGGTQPKINLWLEDINIRIFGETALVTALWYDTKYGAAKQTAVKGPVTFLLIRDDHGILKIAHAHFANYK